jgi:hypothetical protein
MAGSPPPTSTFDWEAAGRDLSASLDRLHAVVVIGANPDDTARVTLGIAKKQARRRRTTIGDLIGEAPAIQDLAPSNDPHGLADVFEYGVSMNKVARKVEDADNLFVLHTGAFVTDPAEIMGNRRWTRAAAELRDENEFLVIAANVNTPDIESLVLQLDGAIIVGESAPPKLPIARILHAIRGPRRTPLFVRTVPKQERKYVIRKQRSWGPMAGIGLAVLIVVMGAWLAMRPFAEAPWRTRFFGRKGVPFRGLDSVVADSIRHADSVAAVARAMGLFTAQDSASVAPFGLMIVSFNTQAGALLELQRNGATLRAGTFTPVLIRETPWFRVIAGAYPDSVAAAALLDTLRARGLSDAGRVVIERYPYALLVERDVPDAEVAAKLVRYNARGLPVYGLLQADGTSRLFAGAFKTTDEAIMLADAMQKAGVPTSLVYRTGRVY